MMTRSSRAGWCCAAVLVTAILFSPTLANARTHHNSHHSHESSHKHHGRNHDVSRSDNRATVKPRQTEFERANVFNMASDRDRARAIATAWRQHESGRVKSPGWTDAVTAIRAETNPTKKLMLADAYVDSHVRYVDRDNGLWAKTPVAAAKEGGLCRDFSTMKAFLLLNAGFPAEDLRIVTLAPGAGRDRAHVVLAARADGKVFLLDMLKGDQSRGGYAIPADRGDLTGSTERAVTAVVAPAAWGAGIGPAVLVASAATPNEGDHDIPKRTHRHSRHGRHHS